MALPQDTLLENRYRIDQLLAQGGMGAIYLAFDIKLQTQVAIKENFFQTPQNIRQFQQEALILARLRYSGLPRVFDHFSFEGQQYLVMDYIEGEDLWMMVKRQGHVFSEAQALDYIIEVCGAVSYLHTQKPPIIHRDIKPQNIKITPENRAVLVDFGIAKVGGGDSRTRTGAQGVTPGFSPPEQYSGSGTNPASDVFSLGATLYAILTGRKPPDSVGRMVDEARFILPEEINANLSKDVCRVIVHAMQLKPGDRPQSVAAWQKELIAIRKTLPEADELHLTSIATLPSVSTSSDTPNTIGVATSKTLQRWIKSAQVHPRMMAVIAVFALVILGGGWLMFGRQAPVPTPTATSQPVVMVSPSATPLPTDTPAPTLTPLPLSSSGSVIRDVEVREGPGEDYADFDQLPQNTVVQVVGRNQKSTWWQIVHPSGPQGRGWVDADNVQLDDGAVPIAALPEIAVPLPTPTDTPTVTPIPTDTPLPPTLTNTPIPPTSTPTPKKPRPTSTPTPTYTPESREFARDTQGYKSLIQHFGGKPTQSESFSPDGKWVAITERVKLYTIDVPGTDLRVWMEQGDLDPAGGVVWSPNGQLIAFIATRKQNCDPCQLVGIVELSSGTVHYPEPPAGMAIDLPRWTEDGRLLVTIHNGNPEKGTTYVYSMSGEGAVASGSYQLSSSHEGQKWYPWYGGRTWQVDSNRPDSYYYD